MLECSIYCKNKKKVEQVKEDQNCLGGASLQF